VADAFGTNHPREKTLAILKDPHIGSFGVGTLVLTVVWRIIAYQQLFNLHQVVWIIYALGISRVLQGLILLWFPYARGSEGKAYGYKGPFWVSIILLLQITSILAIVWYKKGPFASFVPFAVGLVILAPLFVLTMRRIGGVTGDCIGAATELFECVFLAGAIACLR
jgi:adenosylcobinamide-GDP ribazoletransferase